MRKCILAVALVCAGCGGFVSPPASGPETPSHLPPFASGDLSAFVKSELLPSISNVSGSGTTANPMEQHNEYVLPTASQLIAWRTVFERMLAGDYAGAHTLIKSISSTYNVLEYADRITGQRYYLLLEGVPGKIPSPARHNGSVNILDPDNPTRRGWGTYIFNQAPRRSLSLSVPHPKDDFATGEQAIEAFLDLGAHSLLIAGADRDQNVALAPCDQSARPYLEADMAHNAESVFQIAFEEIFLSDASLDHLQFHGNDVCSVDVFLSNGIPTPPAILASLRSNIEAASLSAAASTPALGADVYDDPGDCAMRGLKNTQLRFASGIPHSEVCAVGNNPTAPSRFIHIEELPAARRAPSDPQATPGRNRAIITTAIKQTFP